MAHRTTPRQGLQPQDDPNRLSRYPSIGKATLPSPPPLSSSSMGNNQHARATYTDAGHGQDTRHYHTNSITSSPSGGVERSLAYLLQDMARRTPAEHDIRNASAQDDRQQQQQAIEPLTINKRDNTATANDSNVTTNSSSNNNMDCSVLHNTLRALANEREQLAQAQSAQQRELTASLTAQHSVIQDEVNKVLQAAKEQVRRAQADCAATILRLQQEMTALQRALAAKEMALIEEERLRGDLVARELASRVTAVREELTTQWHAAAEAEAAAQQNALRATAAEYAAANEALRAQYAAREAETAKQHKAQLTELEQSVEERYADQLAEANRTTARQRELIETLRQSNAQLRAELVARSEGSSQRELAVQAAVLHARQVLDAQWQDKFTAMQKHYARLLQRALRPHSQLRRKAIGDREERDEGGRATSAQYHRRHRNNSNREEEEQEYSEEEEEEEEEEDGEDEAYDDDAHAMVPYATHSQALILLHSLEEQCVELKTNTETKVRHAVAEVEALWQQRLEYEKARQAQVRYGGECNLSEAEWSLQMQAMREALFAELQTQEVAQQGRLQEAREQLMKKIVERYAAAAAEDAARRARELEAQCAELRTALTTQAELRVQLMQELRGEYALQLEQMHAAYEGQAAAMQHMWLEWQSTRERHWLRGREDEVRLLAEAHTTERAALMSHHHWLLQQIELHVKGRVDGDVEAFAAREQALLEQLTALQAAQAERTTQQAEQLLAAQRVVLQEAQAAEEQRLQSRWKAMQDDLIQHTWRATEQRTAYETELQERFAAELGAERERFAREVAQLKAEHASALAKARAEASAQERAQVAQDHEAAVKRRVDELTARYEAQLASQAQRHVQQLREADSALQAERARLQASGEALMRDQQETFDLQLQELRGECARRVDEAVAEKERQCRAEAEAAARAECDRRLQELRGALEAKTAEVERLSAELRRVQTSNRGSYSTRMVLVPATSNDENNEDDDENENDALVQQQQQQQRAAVVVSPPSSSSLSSIAMPPSQRVAAATKLTDSNTAASTASEAAMQKLWVAAEQLWHVLEVPQEEQQAIRAEICALGEDAARRAALEAELHERQEQLPLLELATRRDYLLHTLQELQARHAAEEKKGREGDGSGGRDAGEKGRTLSRAPSFVARQQSLQEEIDRVVRQLREEVGVYEEMHPGHRPLLYQGQPLLPS